MTTRTLLRVPTANDYRSIARQLAGARDLVLSLLRPIAIFAETSPLRGGGGHLERTVDTTIAVANSNIAEIAAELRRQIDEATRRVAVCERYAAAVREYRRLDDRAKTFPRRPASWADHG